MPIVVYHYIKDRNKDEFNLRSCSIKDFKKQVKFLLNRYKIVGLDELANLKKISTKVDRYASLTFDDGTADHYTQAFPALLAYGVKATFFPIGCVFENKAPLVIKMHIVFSKIKSRAIASQLEKYLKNNYSKNFDSFSVPTKYRISDKKRLRDSILVANLKQILAELPLEIKSIFVDQLFNNLVKNESRFCKDFFLSPAQLKEMKNKGMSIGSHSYNHTSLKFLSYKRQLEDILKSKQIIERAINGDITSFSYPFGDYNSITIRILKKLGFKYGVSYDHEKLLGKNNALTMSAGDYGDFFK